MLNDLQAFPEIRENFQFWFYFYPSGEPFWYGASRLREDLAEARAVLDPAGTNPVLGQLVLVGHSMGGLVSMWQTLQSDSRFWRLLSDRPFSELKADEATRQEIAQLVFFQPDPGVRRVITIGTPHRGSRFANEYTRFLARKLIRLPTRLLQVKQGLVMKNPGLFSQTDILTMTTSIDSLAPDSPVLPAMLRARRPPTVHYNNIVGVLPEQTWVGRLTNWFYEPGDGVVSYESARREDFDSELVVPADHMRVHAHPRSILEVRRCLLEQLAEVRAGSPQPVAPATYARPPAQGRLPSGGRPAPTGRNLAPVGFGTGQSNAQQVPAWTPPRRSSAAVVGPPE
jgi:pimeloyl-ACP methyl ester carboxylesterase